MRNTTYLLMYRSLTWAQRAARVLERSGITGTVMRAPKSARGKGCGYCVIVSSGSLDRAMDVLLRLGTAPERVLLRKSDGALIEVDNDLP